MSKKKRYKSFWPKITFFILGMVAMMLLDMMFHFNNSVETQLNRELNKAQRKVENIFRK